MPDNLCRKGAPMLTAFSLLSSGEVNFDEIFEWLFRAEARRPGTEGEAWLSLLDKRIKLKGGFRRTREAPPRLVQQNAENLGLVKDRRFIELTLAAWAGARENASLRDAVMDAFARRGASCCWPDYCSWEKPHEWPAGDLDSIAGSVLEASPDLPLHAIRLMACLLGKPGRADDAAAGTRLDEMLDELAALPPEAPEWDLVPRFAERLGLMAEGKLEERNAGPARLSEALERLGENAVVLASFGDAGRLSHWDPKRCPKERVDAVLKDIETVSSLLADLKEPQAASFPNLRELAAATERRYKSLLELERLLGVLDQTLAEPGKEKEAEAAAKEAEEEAALPEKEAAGSPGEKPKEASAEEAPESADTGERAPRGGAEPAVPEAEAAAPDAAKSLPETCRKGGEAPAGVEESPKADATGSEEPEQGEVPAEEAQACKAPSGDVLPEEDAPWAPLDVKSTATAPGCEEPPEDEPPVFPHEALAKEKPREEAREPRRKQAATPRARAAFEKKDTAPLAFEKPAKTSKPVPPEPEKKTDAKDAFEALRFREEAPGSGPDLAGAAQACLDAPENEENWRKLSWKLLLADDLGAAYWVNRFTAEMGKEPCVPHDLIAAIWGGRHLGFDQSALSTDIAIIPERMELDRCKGLETLLLAAALPQLLTQGAHAYLDWLKTPPEFPMLNPLVEAMEGLVGSHILLTPEDLRGATGLENTEERIKAVSRAAGDYLDHKAESRSTPYPPATQVWLHWVGEGSELKSVLTAVMKDERDKKKREQVDQTAKKWADRDYIRGQIKDAQKALGQRIKIEGKAREMLLGMPEEPLRIVIEWIGLVGRLEQMKDRGDWVTARTKQLRSSAQDALKKLGPALKKECRGELENGVRAQLLWRGLYDFQSYFDLSVLEEAPVPAATERWKWMALDPAGLDSSLARRLLWFSGVEMPDVAGPAGDPGANRTALARGLASPADRAATYRDWLDKGDFRFKNAMIASFGFENEFVAERQVEDRIAERREDMRRKIAALTARIEQAFLDGIYSEFDRAAAGGRVESFDLDGALDFPRIEAELTAVDTAIGQARERRMAELCGKWESIRPEILASSMSAEKKKSIDSFMSQRIEQGDTRIIDEILAQLEHFLDTKAEPDASLFTGEAGVGIQVSDFFKRFDELEKIVGKKPPRVIATDLARGDASVLCGAVLPPERLSKIGRVFGTWADLKLWALKFTKSPVSDVRVMVTDILCFLGFTMHPEGSSAKTPDRTDGKWWHGVVRMSAGNLARPFPDFGSESPGSYDVVCFWDQPSPAEMVARITGLRLPHQHVLVFYLGALSGEGRIEIVRQSHDRNLFMAVLDEILLLHCAGGPEPRLPIMLRSSLPFSGINPYKPVSAGNVPDEMFFGREEMSLKLMSNGGGCFVYGGRQLGKSTLLRHVERKFHNPERRQFCKVKEIKAVGDPTTGQKAQVIFEHVRDCFIEFRLLEKDDKKIKPEELKSRLSKIMNEDQTLSIMLMFDEADNFLEADSRKKFRMVDLLRELMAETGRRFKVVFAGLHNVNRYQNIPNQPLIQIGSSICVGPLEPLAARDLVKEPLAALGYEVDEVTTLRILSYTNYHPGLIQLFCWELLEMLHGRTGRSFPPHPVRPELVDAVYRKRSVKDEICKRLELTLALDDRYRYQTIVKSIILDQAGDNNGYSRDYSNTDVAGIVEGWWPKGASDMDQSTCKGLLEELVGLGVLVKKRDRYRLRSPNLVRLMGSKYEIEAQLIETLSKAQDMNPDAVDSYHTPLDKDCRRFSPLTRFQERLLNPKENGVNLVFASRAQGLADLREAIGLFTVSDVEDDIYGAFEDLSPSALNRDSFAAALHQCWERRTQYRKLVAAVFLDSASGELLEKLVECACYFAESRRVPYSLIRVIFVLGPEAALHWFDVPVEARNRLEERVTVVGPLRYDVVGVQQRLALAPTEKAHDDRACERVMAVTGGWPMLVARLLSMSEKATDAGKAVDKMEKDLASERSDLRRDFIESLGLDKGSPAHRMAAIIKGQEVEKEFFVEYIEELMPELAGKAKDLVEYLRRNGIVEIGRDALRLDPVVGRIAGEFLS